MEWRLAARWAGYRYEDFQELDGERQSKHVAAYRIDTYAKALLEQEAARARSAAPPRRSHR